MNIDAVKEYIVIVNGGSGCIFQPMDNAYSYVLTAKHNIADADNLITQFARFKLNNNSWGEIEIPFGNLIENDNYFPHPNRDIAIIKIDKIHDLENIIRIDDIENERTGYLLIGYPELRRNANPDIKANWYRCDENVTIQGLRANQLREGKVPDNAGYEEIVGHSGGGLLKLSGDYILLAGIQNKMIDAKNEQLGRVEFSPISLFDEIINEYPQQLSPLHPPYYKSFAFLKEQIMKLEGCFHDIEYTKQFLRDITDEIVKNPLTPNVIKNYLNERLLIYGEKSSSFYNKGLWVAWLEFLIVLNIVGLNPKTEEELNEIFNQYRIIYSSSKEDWSKLMVDIARSDYKGLKENACLIFANDAEPKMPVLGKGIIPDVSKSVQKRQMNIDDGVNHPFESFKHIHIYAFQQKCIVEKAEDYTQYSSINENELLQKLKIEYENIINN